MRLMELWSTYFGPASDTLLDFGASNYRWKNIYFSNSMNYQGGIAGTGLTVSSANIKSIVNLSFIRFNGISTPASSTFGDFWFDTKLFSFAGNPNGNVVYAGGSIFVSTGNGIVSNTTAETTVIGGGIGSLILYPDYFLPGKTIRINACGLYSTQLVPVGLTMRIRIGGLAGTVFSSTGSQTPAGNLANMWWRMTADITCNSDGGSGFVIGQSAWEHQSTATGSPLFWQMTNTGVTIDTTTDQTIQLTAQWAAGVAAADSMMCTNFTLEAVD